MRCARRALDARARAGLLASGGRLEVRRGWARLTEAGDRFEAGAIAQALGVLEGMAERLP